MRDGHKQAKDGQTQIAEGLPPLAPADARGETPEPSEPTAMEVFFAWEKIRVLYNVYALGAFCLAPQVLWFRGDFFVISHFALIAISANVYVSLGHIFEGYLCWFGISRIASRSITISLTAILLLVHLLVWSISDAV